MINTRLVQLTLVVGLGGIATLTSDTSVAVADNVTHGMEGCRVADNHEDIADCFSSYCRNVSTTTRATVYCPIIRETPTSTIQGGSVRYYQPSVAAGSALTCFVYSRSQYGTASTSASTAHHQAGTWGTPFENLQYLTYYNWGSFGMMCKLPKKSGGSEGRLFNYRVEQ